MTASNRINWLSVLQGWSMLLVVIGHVTLTNVFQNPETPVSAEIERIIYSFHMPLFMFISGFLFYLTKIGRDKGYAETIGDKAKRLLIPYAAFTCLQSADETAGRLFLVGNPRHNHVQIQPAGGDVVRIDPFRPVPVLPRVQMVAGQQAEERSGVLCRPAHLFLFPEGHRAVLHFICVQLPALFLYGDIGLQIRGGEILGQPCAPFVLHGIDGVLFAVPRHSATEYFRRDIFLADPLHVFIPALPRTFRKFQGIYVSDIPDGNILPDGDPVRLCPARDGLPLLAPVRREHPAGFVYACADLQSNP